MRGDKEGDDECSRPSRMAHADDWNRRSVLESCMISSTSHWNGSVQISSSVLFWYGWNWCGFITPPVPGADLCAAFVASYFRGVFPPHLSTCALSVSCRPSNGWTRGMAEARARGDRRVGVVAEED
ncbi:LOW QUALITY PROTEIN: hypothetical protein U9M48_040480 [Paspalum notatum var. saurae]|uniref:Uncharacterized protein n=1 Tax=Paspalum notatum var. saurae TaxID=547442 RepID=A0AAQ3UQL9_PASNO